MSKFLLPVLIVVALYGGVFAQGDLGSLCPKVSVTSIDVISERDQTIEFVADVKGGGRKFALEFVWSSKHGEILSGQGTTRIKLKSRDGASFDATVEIKGLPPNCPSIVSESTIVDWAPPPVKLYTLKGSFKLDTSALDQIAETMRSNPTSQLFIVSGRKHGSPSEALTGAENRAIGHLISNGLDRRQITVWPTDSGIELLQFWRVPPGAENPKCNECEELEKAEKCPTFSVRLKNLAPPPNDEAYYFEAEIKGKLSEEARLVWTVTTGRITEGQGTRAISVDGANKEDNLTATLEITGLGSNCQKSAAETAPIVDLPFPILIDEFSSPNDSIDQERLDQASVEQKNNPSNLLYVIEYFGRNASQFDIRERVKRVSEFLRKELKLGENDFKIVTAKADKRFTKIYRIPPGAELPEP